jgi:hypothetical protein
MIRIASFGLRRLAVPAVAAALLSFTTIPSSAETSASASRLQPGKAAESIAAAATVVSTAYYQATLALTCSGTNCQGDFPAVGNRRQLNLTRVSCLMQSATYGVYTVGRIDLRTTTDGSTAMVQFLPADYSTDFGYHSLNRAVDVQVRTRQNARVFLSLASGGQAQAATCTAHGTLDTIQ